MCKETRLTKKEEDKVTCNVCDKTREIVMKIGKSRNDWVDNFFVCEVCFSQAHDECSYWDEESNVWICATCFENIPSVKNRYLNAKEYKYFYGE